MNSAPKKTAPELIGLSESSLDLIPVIAQDSRTFEVLMLGFANSEAVRITQESKFATFWSRSRQEIWTKGLTSGNRMRVDEIRYDCDSDALLYLVTPEGPACHTGADSCFYRTL